MAPRLAVIVPCYNEEVVLTESDADLRSLLKRLAGSGDIAANSFILYVDDGSKDDTWARITSLAEEFPGVVCGLKLGHNVGHQNALMAGLEAVVDQSDIVLTIDADLQDDIEAIPQMIREFEKGAEIIYGVRKGRDSDSWFKRNSAAAFYKSLKWLGVESVSNHADFRMMSARAVRELLRYKEANLFLRGIVPRIGLQSSSVAYDRKERTAGQTKYSVKKMLGFAVEGITSFSVKPVRMVFAIGVVFLAIALIILIYTLCRYFSHHTIEGWASLILSIWFCSGVLLMALGIIGEYIGKIYLEVKGRPRYVVESRIGFES